MVLFLTASIAGCEAIENNNFEHGAILDAAPLAGTSWDFINEQGVKAEWRVVEAKMTRGNTVFFESQFKDKGGLTRDLILEVEFEAEDHVTVLQRNAQGLSECQYIGHIWTETSLENYDSFNEIPSPSHRPVFYRIVTGTYSCEGMEEPETWIAKINE